MESLILEILPLERRPVLVRYAISGLFVLVAFLSRYVLATTMQGYPYLLFIPAVFAIAHTDQSVAEMRTNSSSNVGRPLFDCPSFNDSNPAT